MLSGRALRGCAGLRHRVFARPSRRCSTAGVAAASSAPKSDSQSNTSGHQLMEFLRHEGGVEGLPIDIRTVELEEGRPLDVVVAKDEVHEGQVLLDVPDHLVITLNRIFDDEFVAELLTNDKLSELAILTLYLMYEKKTGAKSFWAPYIKELDRQRARGPQAVASPLLWSDEELEDLLQGSPLLAAVRARQAGIKEEYEALDTVWFMASSLFKSYPFDMPTEAFPFELFQQAFAAVQASIVHLQGVPGPKRFALVPLGPPLLSYSSTAKAMITYDTASNSVQLVADREYAPGEAITAWCGPQSNSRLLLNYGIVDENNPFDKLQMTVTLPNTDPLFRAKRDALQPHGLSTQTTFDLSRSTPLPPALRPFMRLALARTEEQLAAVTFPPAPPPSRGRPTASNSSTPAPAAPVSASTHAPTATQASEGGEVAGSSPETEAQIVSLLTAYLTRRLAAYKHPLWHDIEVIDDDDAPPRAKVAARLTKIEKSILMGSVEALSADEPMDAEAAAKVLAASAIKFS